MELSRKKGANIMKRVFALLLTLSMLFSLCACAGGSRRKMTAVDNVDDFLKALGSGKTITLSPGTYNLCTASDYGQDTASAYYMWQPLWDNEYQLVLTGLDDTHIIGDGAEIVTEPRSAAVISMRNCTRLMMEHLTLGHTVMAEACEGPVLDVQNCTAVSLFALDLYGCGMLGVHAVCCDSLMLADSDIHDCSGGGIHFYQCRNSVIDDCRLRNIGYNDYGWGVFSFNDCEDAVISDCTVENSTVTTPVNAFGSGDVLLRNIAFTDVTAVESVFDIRGTRVSLDNVNFDETHFSRWYSMYSDYAFSSDGEIFQPQAPSAFQQEVKPAEAVPVTTNPQKTVKVRNMDEFLEALDSDTEIILIGREYNISDASDYGTTGGKYYHWEDIYDGPQLVIKGITNLTIHANDRNFCTISAEPRYANVLQFENCYNVTLHGFTAGHTKEPGQCVGGVLRFVNCKDCLVDECGLFGCGTLGVDAQTCTNLQVINTNIYECSYGGIEANGCDRLTIAGCDFWALGGEFFRFSGVMNATVDGQEVPEYYYGY